MEKRLIIAIALSIFIIVAFQMLGPKPGANRPLIQPRSEQKIVSNTAEEPSQKPYFEEKNIFKEKDTVVETRRYILIFSNIGGSLKDVKLKDYTNPTKEEPMQLVSNAVGERAIFSMKSNVLTTGLDEKEFTLAKKTNDSVSYTFSIPGQFTVIKEYTFYSTNDYIELRISLKNLGTGTAYKDYDLMGASSLESAGMAMGRRFLEIDSMVDGKVMRNSSVKNGELFVRGIVSWTGIKERYFCIILKPQQNSDGVILKQFDKTTLASGVRSERASLYPGSTLEDRYVLYIGPNDIKRLSSLGMGLEQIINYGVFGGITKFLLSMLRIFYNVTRNWGLAIIMLTVLINLVLFPLTSKSFHSMRKIQEVQPHIEKLRKLHKDNPQKLNKELAELYRQYNINPFGGCLPLLLQMPIFIALYQGLIRSIELKGANFLWIKDLSHPDIILLPIKLPLVGNEIHLLPILMAIAMFAQQKISSKGTPATTTEQIQQQKLMLILFPIFFGFLFYNFPSGLVLYWLTNTVLMTTEQFIMKRSAAKV